MRPLALHLPPAIEPVILADGTSVYARALEPSDRDELRRMFSRLSPDSRYRRFHGPKVRLSERELDELTRIDHRDHDAVAAFTADDAIVGVARYVRFTDRPQVADVAAEVVDELHDLGLGTRLAGLIIARARANGIRVLTATVLWDNLAARALVRRMGFRTRRSDGPTIELELKL